MSTRQDYIKANRANWNDRVAVHLKDKEYYDIEQFLSGKSTLEEIEKGLVGDVAGKKLLHLMCHFGLDSLSWARLGAKVTGVDFSPAAIEAAQDLACRAGLEARFIECDVNKVTGALNEKFDIVIATYGILAWLSDIDVFVSEAAACLVPGGKFVLVDFHPIFTTLEPDDSTGQFVIAESYFSQEEPEAVEDTTSYTNRGELLKHTRSYQWNHGMADIINTCLRNSIAIESVGEYPFVYHEFFPGHLVRDGKHWIPSKCDFQMPMLFSIYGIKK